MTAAAVRMNVTQPAVSRLIRDLEHETALSLFRRRGNQVTPTPQAHALLAEVERSFVGIERIAEFARELRLGPTGLLRLVALPAMAGFLPRFVARYCRERPRLRVVLDSLSSPAIRDKVADGVFDLGICAAPFSYPGLLSTPLEDAAVVVIPAGHPLGAKPTIRLDDLRGQDMVLIDKFQEGRHPFELALQAMQLGRVLRTPLCTLACAMVAEGAGIALIDPFSASEFVGRGVLIRTFEPSVMIGVAVIHSAARGMPAPLQEFRDSFVTHARAFTRDAAYLRP